jgi:hypothetical protein
MHQSFCYLLVVCVYLKDDGYGSHSSSTFWHVPGLQKYFNRETLQIANPWSIGRMSLQV